MKLRTIIGLTAVIGFTFAAMAWPDILDLDGAPREYAVSQAVHQQRELTGTQLLRTVTATDSPAIGGTTGTWTTGYASAKRINARKGIVSISVLALDATSDPADGQVAWALWIVPWYGPMIKVGYGTWAMGALEVSHNPATGTAIGTDASLDDETATNYAWGDPPTITATYGLYDLVSSGATDNVGELSLKVPDNIYGIYFEVTDFAAASTIDSLFVFMR